MNLNRTPADAARIFNKLVTNRDTLIAPDNQDPNWSRWHNFKARHVACGHEPPAYYISYGYYYCSNFQRYLYPRLKSSQGQRWMRDARKLLQEYMDDGLRANMQSTLLVFESRSYPKKKIPPMKVDIQQLELQNDTFKQFAFRTHVPAYLDGGIADVPIADLMRVFGQPNVEEWADPETWKQAVDVAWEVVPHKVKNPLDTAQEAADAAVQAGSYVFEQTAESIQKGAGYMVKKANGVWEWVFGK
ncbi:MULTISPECIES: hypothetical protein [unclassified Neisseria]|uniref:hypothetical protein n=1 Tax=unclassified Neisseria TaxID=2623750 RepID=UPI002664E471|nr:MULTISPECIES: hypothetical protein [unclassified Neisseria]MDO1517289.1 hypothetical protein [Neisseria sp. MVDL18-041461]MDO1563153.1 hypothetical protein [Neisseria sp. MVDL20-010259]